MAINHRILYVGSSTLPETGNSLATMINNVLIYGEADDDFQRLAKWCDANQITAIKWYLAGSTSLRTWQGWRFVIEKLRGEGTIYSGVKSHQLVFSGRWGSDPFPSTHDDTNDPYGFIDTTNYDVWVDGIPPGPAYNGSPQARWFTNSGVFGAGTTYEDFKNTGYDLEYEFWNQSNPQRAFTDVWAPKMTNGCLGLWYQENPQLTVYDRTVNANTSYVGRWSGGTGLTAWSVPAPQLIVATHTRLDMDNYQSYPSVSTASIFNHRSRLNDLANAQAAYAANPTPVTTITSNGTQVYGHINPRTVTSPYWPRFEYYPIFSLQTANLNANGTYNHINPFADPLSSTNSSGMICYNGTLPGVTPVTGLNLTFDELFNCYLTGNKFGTGTARGFKQWQLANTTGNANFIKEPDGYVLFSYIHAFYARPI